MTSAIAILYLADFSGLISIGQVEVLIDIDSLQKRRPNLLSIVQPYDAEVFISAAIRRADIWRVGH